MPSTEVEEKNNLNESYHYNEPEAPLFDDSRVKQKAYNSVKKTRKLKSPPRFCGNQKCKICKKLKPVLPKHYESYASR